MNFSGSLEIRNMLRIEGDEFMSKQERVFLVTCWVWMQRKTASLASILTLSSVNFVQMSFLIFCEQPEWTREALLLVSSQILLEIPRLLFLCVTNFH